MLSQLFKQFLLNFFFRYFGIHTMWYLHSHFVWLKLFAFIFKNLLLNFERFFLEILKYSRICQTFLVSPA